MKLRTALPLTLLVATLPLYGASYGGKKGDKPSTKEEEKSGEPQGWFDWRGPLQTGVSLEKGLPEKVDANSPLWTADFPGQSAPVIANGKLYIMGYLGEGPD